MSELLELQPADMVSRAPIAIRRVRPRTEPRTRRVLMLCCAFPPTGGPGVQRSAKFAKYLPHWGWIPTVWSANRLRDLPLDATLLADLPAELNIVRTAASDPRDTFERLLGRLPWRLDNLLLRALRRIPLDHQVIWALRSYRACRDLIANEGIDVIYSTYSPPSNHLLGWLLRRATGKPWVADFRDLWTHDYCYPHRGLRRWIERGWERRFVETADAVIGVNPAQTTVLAGLAPERRERFYTVTNGFDTADLAGVDPAAARARLHGPADQFVLAFSGTFHSDRVAEGFLDGLASFARRGAGNDKPCVLRVVGKISTAMLNALRATGLPIECTGYVAHHEAIAHLYAADALLLLAPGGAAGESLLPAKLFEYLASGRPILAVVPSENSQAARFVTDCDAGMCVHPTANDVERALSEFSSLHAAHALPHGCAPSRLVPFTRKHLAARLAEILDSVEGGTPADAKH
jgi:glycosyltransferase involved in cell wall biosynthesis